MDKLHFDNILSHRKKFFHNNGKVIEPVSIRYEKGKPLIYFPDIRCPFCEGSLVTQPQAGLVEYRVKINDNWTRLYVSFFMEDKFHAVRDEAVVMVKGDVLEKVTCPLCNESLLIDSDCDYCHSILIGVDVNFLDDGECYNYEFCSKKGCRFHRIDIPKEDLERYFLSEEEGVPILI
ncbi:MAG: hypothetical protein ACMUIP_08045 [bacterium]